MSRTVDEIKEKVNIIDVVGQVVQLKRTGINYKGLCPFHQEKTPSFVVSEQRQNFHCFGCGVGGDAIEFVKQYYNLDFTEAVEKLAGQYGIPVEWGKGDHGEREEFYRINREAAAYFYRQLRKGPNPGLSYAAGRGLTKETLHTFGIGYAPDDWTGLYDHLKEKGIDEDKMMKLGLISKSGSRYYDKFRSRLIFPIQNTAGKIIGFGGRILGDGQPKYLNSQETPVFQKKNNLYGLYQSKAEAVKEDKIVLVEGYMDAVSLYQGGIHNVAASLGTALTENQVRLIKRYTKNAYLCYDSDEAGIRAALRGMDIFQAEGMDVRVLHVTEGKDPDDFIKQRGKEAFLDLMDAALPYADYKIRYLEGQHDLSTDRGRVAFLMDAARVLARLGPVEADMYTKELSDRYGISRDAIRREMEGSRSEKTPVRRQPEKEEEAAAKTPIDQTERLLIKIFLTQQEFLDREEEWKEVFKSDSGRAIAGAMSRLRKKAGSGGAKEPALAGIPDGTAVLEQLDENDQIVFLAIRDGMPAPVDPQSAYKDCLAKAQRAMLRKKEQDLIDRLALADGTVNKEEVDRITEELIDVQRKLKS
ncbi:MAG: DNA primase [Clostridiales bacterium]|nr:DNA primase [Clostridiales bacterium]